MSKRILIRLLFASSIVGFSFQNCSQYAGQDVLPAETLVVSLSPLIGVVNGAITLNATVSGDAGAVEVRFLIDGKPLGEKLTAFPYTAVWDTRLIADGRHTVSVTAMGANGRTGSFTRNVVTQNAVPAAPVVTGVYPAKTVAVTPLTISGRGFDPVRNVISIDGPFAKNFVVPGVAGGQLVTFTLPEAATPGAYTVKVHNGKEWSAAGSFTVVTAPSPYPAPSAASAQSTLVVSPNPCVLDSTGKCSVAVSWNTPVGATTLWASRNGDRPVLIACKSGVNSQAIPWVLGKSTYEFSLYEASSCENVGTSPNPLKWLASITTTGIPSGSLQYAPINIGMCKLELFTQYQGRPGVGALGTYPERIVETLRARKAMNDAKMLYGANFIRFSPIGYWPQDLVLWLADPQAFWTLMDESMHDLAARGISAAPYFNWHPKLIPTLVGETEADLYGDPNSESYLLFAEFVRQFVSRYAKDPQASISFYTVGGETNNGADLQRRSSALRGWLYAASGEYSTNQMISFQTRVASLIRTIDPTRPISSGNAVARPSASHLRVKPYWTGGPDWTLDSKTQLDSYLTYISQGLELIEIHLYNPPSESDPNASSSMRFCPGPDCTGGRNSAGLLDVYNEVARKTGKEIYIAEYGDFDPYLKEFLPGFGPFIKDVLDRTVSLRIAYSAPWTFEMYDNRTTTYNSQPTTQNIEPGYTDALISYMRQKNQALGSVAVPSRVALPEIEVVLTNPLDGSKLTDASTLLYAVASAPRVGRSVASVRFSVNGTTVATVSKPPYQYALPHGTLGAGTHTLVAQAVDSDGRVMTSNAATVSCAAEVCTKNGN